MVLISACARRASGRAAERHIQVVPDVAHAALTGFVIAETAKITAASVIPGPSRRTGLGGTSRPGSWLLANDMNVELMSQ